MHLLLDGWLKERLEQIGLPSILVMKLSGNSSQARKKEVMEIFGSGWDSSATGGIAGAPPARGIRGASLTGRSRRGATVGRSLWLRTWLSKVLFIWNSSLQVGQTSLTGQVVLKCLSLINSDLNSLPQSLGQWKGNRTGSLWQEVQVIIMYNVQVSNKKSCRSK